jgi:sirohydrochlorin ferrochelatase
MTSAVVLLGHGSRAEGVSERMLDVARALAACVPTMTVRAAHRELCEPTLEQVVAELVVSGANRIVVLPYFLHLGLHIQHDIPVQLSNLRERYPEVEFVLAEHLGYDERLVPVLLERLSAALGASV